jgi:hypothetical protein
VYAIANAGSDNDPIVFAKVTVKILDGDKVCILITRFQDFDQLLANLLRVPVYGSVDHCGFFCHILALINIFQNPTGAFARNNSN